MKRTTILLVFIGLLAALQLIRPDRSVPVANAAIDLQTVAQPPAEVLSVLKAACYDCHSNETAYPWYSQVAPLSWYLQNHVNEGREKLNFSTIGLLAAEDRAEIFGEAAEAVQEAEMPLNDYTWLHPEARLSADQRNTLVAWLNSQSGEGGGNTVAEDED